LFVILTKRATRAAGRISDSFAHAKPVPVSEIAQRSFAAVVALFVRMTGATL
jgi:hypothetical protein